MLKSHSEDNLCCCIKEWLYHRKVDAAGSVFGLRGRREIISHLLTTQVPL